MTFENQNCKKSSYTIIDLDTKQLPLKIDKNATKILTNKLSTKMLQRVVVNVVTIVMTEGYFRIFSIDFNYKYITIQSNQTKIDYFVKKVCIFSKMQFFLTNKLPNYVIPVRSKWWKNWIIISKTKIATSILSIPSFYRPNLMLYQVKVNFLADNYNYR